MSDEPQNVADKAVADPLAEVATEQPETVDTAATPTEPDLDEAPQGEADDASDNDQTNGTEIPEADRDEAIGDDQSSDQDDEIAAEEVTSGEVEQAELPEETLDEAIAVEPTVEEAEPIKMDWYILKVQSNRERSISEALRRKIAIEGLDEYFGDVVVPTEKVTEFKGGKKKVVERKLYPGYIVVHMCINDDTWFAVRETAGIGDFTGSGGKPTPMLPHEVARIIQKEEEEQVDAPKLNIRFEIEDRVKIKEGTFEGFEGDVSTIDTASGRVTVMINIFGRSTPVELEYWQIESV